MPRWLQLLVVCFALLAVSGAPALAASVLRVDPCGDDCGEDEDEGEDEDTDAEHAEDGCPEGGPADCSPFCHGCACFSPYAQGELHIAIASVHLPAGENAALVFARQAPPSPPSPGVFHPPRRDA